MSPVLTHESPVGGRCAGRGTVLPGYTLSVSFSDSRGQGPLCVSLHSSESSRRALICRFFGLIHGSSPLYCFVYVYPCAVGPPPLGGDTHSCLLWGDRWNS